MSNDEHNPQLDQLRSLIESHLEDKDAINQGLQQLDGLAHELEDKHASLEKLRKQQSAERLQHAFMAKAAREQLIAPEDALKLLPDDQLKLNDDGSVEGLDEAFQSLRETRPYLFAQSATPGLTQREEAEHDPAQQLFTRAQESGLTRDIQLWRESRRR